MIYNKIQIRGNVSEQFKLPLSKSLRCHVIWARIYSPLFALLLLLNVLVLITLFSLSFSKRCHRRHYNDIHACATITWAL